MHLVILRVGSSFFFSSALGFYYFCDIKTGGCAKPAHVGVHKGKKKKDKIAHLCIPNITANWYTQIYMWECDFCLSQWCCCSMLLMPLWCYSLSLSLSRCARSLCITPTTGIFFEIFSAVAVIVRACFGIPCWCFSALALAVPLFIYMSFGVSLVGFFASTLQTAHSVCGYHSFVCSSYFCCWLCCCCCCSLLFFYAA